MRHVPRAWRPAAAAQRKVLDSIRDLCTMEPLCMSHDAFAAACITGHSFHGSPADMVRFMGVSRGFSFPADSRAASHWLRDKTEAAPTAPRQTGARPPGAANERGAMTHRYTGGQGRRGEREEQLSLRGRINAAVKSSLRAFGRPWYYLPPTLESWDILLVA